MNLEDLYEDVVRRILVELVALEDPTDFFDQVSVKNLSCTSRRMRSHCLPILFQSCHGFAAIGGVPPESIRPYVRNVHYTISFDMIHIYRDPQGRYDPFKGPHPGTSRGGLPAFGRDLLYFPAARSVTFGHVPGGVLWTDIMRLLDRSHGVVSLSIGRESPWMSTPPPTPADFALHPCRLTNFSYTPFQWRAIDAIAHRRGIESGYALESAYLHALVLAMSDTAESLKLPVETAPLVEMAARDWPRLRSLSLIGEYMNPEQCRTIPLLLRRMPNLRSLSVEVAQRLGMERPILMTLPEIAFRLRSLTISYPNPDDPIFSCLGDGLVSLSLRDSPRYCFRERYALSPSSVHPILTSSECLAVLRRIPGPQLSILQLVYQADDAEDELLRYLPQAFPLLQELELHRYRVSQDEDVPYLHIARTLTAVKNLRALYLNLDIRDSFLPPWRTDGDSAETYMDAAAARAEELLDVLRAAEQFEFVALFLHQKYECEWTLFRPKWSAGSPIRFAVDCLAYMPRIDIG